MSNIINIHYMLTDDNPPTVNLTIDGIVFGHRDTDDLGEIIDQCMSAIAEVEAWPTAEDVAEERVWARSYDDGANL